MPNIQLCKKCGHDLDDHTPSGCALFGCGCDRSCRHDTNVSPEQERADALQTALDLMATLYWARIRSHNPEDDDPSDFEAVLRAVLSNPPAKEAYEKARGA